MALKEREPGSGGFLNNEDATIVGAKFDTSVFNKGEKDEREVVSLELEIQQDGADETVQQFADFGRLWDDMEVSKDGLTLKFKQALYRCNGTRLLRSIFEDAPSLEESIAPDDNSICVKPLAGLRVTFGKEIDTEKQIAIGKKKLGKKAKDATDEEILAAGKREGKGTNKGKFFNQDRLVVLKVLATDAKASKKGAKADKAEKGGKSKEKEADSEAPDQDALDKAIVGLVKASKKEKILKSGISAAMMRYAVSNDLDEADAEAIRKGISEDKYLAKAAKRGVIAYDSDEEVITLPEDDD